jgi:hypothetical protein
MNTWQYSREIYLIGRNLRQSGKLSDAERTAVEEFIQKIGNPKTGSRPWLSDRLRLKTNRLSDIDTGVEVIDKEVVDTKRIAVNISLSKRGNIGYILPASVNPNPVIDPINPAQNDYAECKMIQLIGRDLKIHLPITEQEKIWCDELIAATKTRKNGYHPGVEEVEENQEEVETPSSNE